MNLVIDIGNTYVKLAVFKQDTIVESKIVSNHFAGTILELLRQFCSIKQCIISSVRSDSSDIINTLKNVGIPFLILNPSLHLPFSIQYHTPETLGNDRIAAVAGAFALYPDSDIFIIDAGTAITFELITKDEGYLGGTISPGLEMRYKALHTFTDRLPMQSKKEHYNFIGQSTTEALVSGVQNGLVFEIEGYLTKISKNYPQIIVLLTGGDAQFFDNKLKRTIFVIPNLTLIGLNFILNYNAQA